MTYERAIWIGVAVAVLIGLLGIALFGYLSGRWDEGGPFALASAETTTCMSAEEAEKVRGVMLVALDDALRQQIIHVFEVWMKDDRDQPNRARIGVRQAIRAYIGSRKGVADWQPAICP